MSSREFFQKNKQMNLFLLLSGVFSFVFWKNLKTPKKPFDITFIKTRTFHFVSREYFRTLVCWKASATEISDGLISERFFILAQISKKGAKSLFWASSGVFMTPLVHSSMKRKERKNRRGIYWYLKFRFWNAYRHLK